MVKHLGSAEEFDVLIKSNILVDFYADWCGPCRMLAPVLEEIDSIDILKVNVDEYQNIANRYGVMSIPTIILFENGREKSRLIGLKSKDEILDIIK